MVSYRAVYGNFERLRRKTDETVDLAVLNMDRVFFVDKTLLAGLADELIEAVVRTSARRDGQHDHGSRRSARRA